MSVNWNQEWEVKTPGGGLSAGDRIKFESLEIKHKAKTAVLYDPTSFGTYSPVLTPTVKTCTVTVGSAAYLIEYQENAPPQLDELRCTTVAGRPGGEASATSHAGILSWSLGGVIGMAVGLGLGLLLDVPWVDALAIAFAAALAAAIGSKVVGDVVLPDPPNYPDGPGGPSWTAIEGG